MRDPKRIERVLARVREAWERNPDLRLGQLIHNCVNRRLDAYYLEDDILFERLRELYGVEDAAPVKVDSPSGTC